MNKQQRLQLIRQIHQGDQYAAPMPATAPKAKPLRRRWAMTPMVPLGESSRHRALPNYMYTTLRSRT